MYVHAEGGLGAGVAGADGRGGLVVQGAVVQVVHTVLLGRHGGRQVHDNLGYQGGGAARQSDSQTVRGQLDR